ncbi:MAG: hypothetical protein JJ938_15305 [Roseicyclus sp.]|nr:hypothetical protein [Roseicyclus sp.]MBO6626246.1 hypothetical protein [Roseicyclus sp.]MBO6923566.1 hypothetical protein [Roseicyclus sp.]
MTVFLTFLADALMVVAALGAALYCFILSRRLIRLSSIDKGLGGAIAVLSAQVDDMNKALEAAKSESDSAASHLQDLTHQAREIASDLELMIAACHDVAAPEPTGDAVLADDAQPHPGEEFSALPEEDTDPEAEDPATETPLFARRRPAPEPEEQSAQPVFRHRRSGQVEAAQ